MKDEHGIVTENQLVLSAPASTWSGSTNPAITFATSAPASSSTAPQPLPAINGRTDHRLRSVNNHSIAPTSDAVITIDNHNKTIRLIPTSPEPQATPPDRTGTRTYAQTEHGAGTFTHTNTGRS